MADSAGAERTAGSERKEKKITGAGTETKEITDAGTETKEITDAGTEVKKITSAAHSVRPMKTVEDSRTEQVHLIMHQHLNSGGRLFGGMLIQWVDEVASVVAMRHAGTNRVTTAAIDNLRFKEPTYEGELLVLIGYVTWVGNSSMEVEIDSYVERSDGMRYLVNRAFFVMVALDPAEKPTQVPGLLLLTEAEKARYAAGTMRRDMRKNRSKSGF